MQTRMGWNPYVKGLVFWFVFMVMYFLYKAFPVFPLSLICATNESNFQHYKAGFVVYLITCAIEYAVVRKRIANGSTYLFSRLLAATFLPRFFFILWYIAPALIGRWSIRTLETIYANTTVIIVGCFVALFEQGLEQIQFSRQLSLLFSFSSSHRFCSILPSRSICPGQMCSSNRIGANRYSFANFVLDRRWHVCRRLLFLIAYLRSPFDLTIMANV